MKVIVRYIVVLVFLSLSAHGQSPRTTIDFNKDWKFLLGNDSLAIAPAYDDSKWRTLRLPHDWSIEGDFAENNPATTQGGALPGGIGWYRKRFVLPVNAKNKEVTIGFDGIYRNSEVWINGHYLGKRPNGYISFSYDLTPYINRAPATNVITVKVDNSEQPNSRWYTGSGIYRNTRLVLKEPIMAIREYGVVITTPSITAKEAVVSVSTVVSRLSKMRESFPVYTDIYDATGKRVATGKGESLHTVHDANGGTQFQSQYQIKDPVLWSVDKPYLYKAITRVMHKGKIVDEQTTWFGIRSFHFDPDKGFFLNGKSLKILGVCNHHDLGAIGAVVNKRAIERQLEILKKMGCNAIRTAHNPPSPELLDLCDRMGFLVMVEAFDMWRKKKNKFDYYSDFKLWHRRDLEDMVKRDLNHPSVFMWSIGNEIREQFDSTGITITNELVAIVKAIDTTRPVIAALSEWNPEKNFMYQSGAFDIVGLNYHHEVYKSFKKYYPGKSFLGAENMSALATRGYYDLPSDSIKFWPEHSPLKYVEKGNSDYTVTAYDRVAAYWGSTHEETWKIIKSEAYLSGLFVWTGFDYLGEPTPYPWPARSSYFGIIDLAGFPKDVYYMYQSEWTNKPVLHIFPHWTWKPGQVVDLWAYYNNADEVELFLNGRSLGIRKKINDELHVMWRVPFEPGELKAVSRRNGKTVLVKKINSAGAPARIELVADRSLIKADGNDLSFVTVRILDKDGNLVPDSDRLIHYTVRGEGMLEATDNGFQADLTPFRSADRKCWKGMGLVIVRSTEKKGNITLMAKCDGLPDAVITLKTGN